MRILILANEDEGLYQFRGELLRELLKENHVFTATPRGEYILDLKEMGCRVIETDFERHGVNPFHDLFLFQKYIQIIKEVKPDIILTYTIKPNIYGGLAASLNKIPYLSNITGLGTALETPSLIQKVVIILYKISLKKASMVFVQNKENVQFLIKHRIIKDNYRLIPGSGVNLEHFNIQPFPEGETVDFAFISRIMKQKGIEQYLEAAKTIKQKYPKAVFHICGYHDGEYEKVVERYQKEGYVIYHGNLRDIRQIYKIIQCTVHPSYYPEGLSNVLLESAASGRAIITTTKSGCKEVVDDGLNGYLVKQRDSVDLIEKIEKFISLDKKERKKMGERGRAKVENEFDRRIVVDAYMEEIKRIINDRL